MEPFVKEQMLYDLLSQHIDHFCIENNLTICQVLGLLDLLKSELIEEFKNEEED